MKNLTNITINLFESTIAKFKLSVKSILVSKKPDNTLSPLVWVSNKGNASLNPNVYLVFGYRDDQTKDVEVYTSFPQIYPIRQALNGTMETIFNDDNFYLSDATGMLEVKPNVLPQVITNVGRDNATITFSAVTFSNRDPQVKEKGVAIHLSTSQFTSLLTVEEFLTIYTIINEINLTHLKVEIGALYALYPDENPQTTPKSQGGYQPKPHYSANQALNNTRGGYVAPTTSGRGGYQPQTTNLPEATEVDDVEYIRPVQQQRVQPQPQQKPMADRTSSGILMNMDNIEKEVPVTTTNFNDDNVDAAISGLFADEE